MQQLYTANKEKQRRRKEKIQERRNVFRAEQEEKNVKRLQKQREERKKIFRMMGQAEKRKKRTWFCRQNVSVILWFGFVMIFVVLHGYRLNIFPASRGLSLFFRVAANRICLRNLLIFKTGFCLMWNALFLLRLQRLEISEPTVLIAQTGSVSYVARD